MSLKIRGGGRGQLNSAVGKTGDDLWWYSSSGLKLHESRGSGYSIHQLAGELRAQSTCRTLAGARTDMLVSSEGAICMRHTAKARCICDAVSSESAVCLFFKSLCKH